MDNYVNNLVLVRFRRTCITPSPKWRHFSKFQNWIALYQRASTRNITANQRTISSTRAKENLLDLAKICQQNVVLIKWWIWGIEEWHCNSISTRRLLTSSWMYLTKRPYKPVGRSANAGTSTWVTSS